VASAFGGQMYVSGSPSTSLLKPFGEQSYYTASLYAAIAVLLALRKRGQTGKGEHVDLSLQEAVVSTLDHVMVRYFYEKVVPQRHGSMHWNHSFCVLPCKGGHILVTLFERWDTLVEWLESEGMDEDLKDERYKEEAYRLERINHIMQVLERLVAIQDGKILAFSGNERLHEWRKRNTTLIDCKGKTQLGLWKCRIECDDIGII
jgi:crotonobetainyl-CoA:carnitine CoA-transferase CaiB-like acyl-CoA transferase